jgi:hypothetical protein
VNKTKLTSEGAFSIVEKNKINATESSAATVIKKIKNIYYWDSTVDSLSNWILSSLWTSTRNKTCFDIDDHLFKYKDVSISYDFKQNIFTVSLFSEDKSFYTIGLHLSSYLEMMYGVKTFEELQNSFIFDIQEFERLSKVIAKDIDVWVKNVTTVYEELCST